MEQTRSFQILECLVLWLAVAFVLLGTNEYFPGDTADSRLATVYSLVKDGAWYLDRPLEGPPNPFEQRTIDKVVLDGHVLSSKPPMLSLLMTAEYLALNKTLGWDFEDKEGEENIEDINKIVRVMSMTLIGLAFVAALIFFRKTLHLFVPDPLVRLLLLFSFAFCTQLWGFSTGITNHVPAAAMIVIAVYYALGLGSGKLEPRAWRFFLFGLTGGLVPTLDLPGTIFVFLAGLYLLYKRPGNANLLIGCMGAAIPLLAHCAAMLAATGSVVPVQMRKELYLSEASYWRNPQTIDSLNEPRAVYLFHITFGRCGLFSLYPVLLGGVAAAVRAVYKKNMPYRGYVLGGAFGFAILTCYYVLKTNNYGGEAYGFRWYIVAMPILLLMAAPVLSSLRARWKWIFVSIMIAISFYSGWECARQPWGANHQWTCRLFLGPSYGPFSKYQE